MFKNYFKAAWRNLWRNKFYAAISISGLTIGLTAAIIILIWVRSELTINHFAGKEKNIYRINTRVHTGAEIKTVGTTPAPVATFALSNIPGVKNTARIGTYWNYQLYSYKQASFKSLGNAAYIDPRLFNMLGVKFTEGNAAAPFVDKSSVVMTQSTAAKYFGKESAVGKVILGNNRDQLTITGVIEDFPSNTYLKQYDMFFSLPMIASAWYGDPPVKTLDDDWGDFSYTSFIELQPGASIPQVEKSLTDINHKYDPNAGRANLDKVYSLQPISRIGLYTPDGKPAEMLMVRIFIIAALFVLIIAGINYVNLSTARAMLRAKEVSIKKITGAKRIHLFLQFITESALYFSISLLLALAAIPVLIPLFNSITGREIPYSFFNGDILKMITVTFISILLLSAVYPAMLLSSFHPIQALRGKLMAKTDNQVFRKVLVTAQFVFSVGLIIGTVVIARQVKYIRTMDPGYNKDQVFTFFMRDEMMKHAEAVKAEMAAAPGVSDVAAASNYIYYSAFTTGDVSWNGKPANTNYVITQMFTDEKFIPLMGLKLLEGKNFPRIANDSLRYYILNETAVRQMGIKDPVGKSISLNKTEGAIVGVVKDFNFLSLKQHIGPMVIACQPRAARLLYVRTSGQDASLAIAASEKLWKKYSPDFPFDYVFLDEGFSNLYKAETVTSELVNIFAAIAIFLSCLGLFGLVTYTVQVKQKEIGIRKVLGASAYRIVFLLSGNFLRLVAIAFLIAAPVAWWVMNSWLNNFAFRIRISWWLFALTGFITIGIVLFTISFQAIKAAMANPVKSLRTE